jgi:hypothetical protein
MSQSLERNSTAAKLTNEMMELICRCLCKCGEEEGYMPLFKVIFTALNDIDENRFTRLLDGRARDILLTGVITRMVHHVAKHIGVVFICDDVQCKFFTYTLGSNGELSLIYTLTFLKNK